MAAPVRLETLRSLPTTAIFNHRSEYDRFVNLVKHWQRDNPSVKAGDTRSLIAERLIILHVLIQRLHDKRYFWDGSPTTFQNAGSDHAFTMSAEDAERKDKEFWRYYSELHKWQLDLLKLAMASSVNLNLSGEIGSIQSLFGALDSTEKRQIASYGINGNGHETETDSI